LTPVEVPAHVAPRATATDPAPRILFVLCLFAVAARLIFINQPYIDHWSWRQSDVAAIARNFLQNGFRLGYPQIDWADNTTGYVATEFPILPFIAAICYKLRACTNGSGESRRSFCSRFRCHFSFCSSGRSLEARLRSYPEFARHLTNNATLIEGTPEFRIYMLDPPSEVKSFQSVTSSGMQNNFCRAFL
jgi:hypothetical protein